VLELVPGETVQLGSAQYQDVQEFVADGGTNVVTVANTDTDFVYLYGGSDNDTLFGGTGNDFLYGGTGTNTFKFAPGWARTPSRTGPQEPTAKST
jgi:Ca2+-binding RTX toxin-like protein